MPLTTYPGGKGLLYQRFISLIPPHRVYIAAFAGFDAIARMKRAARENILIDMDAEALEALRSAIVGNGAAAASSFITSGAPIVENGGIAISGDVDRPVENGEVFRKASSGVAGPTGTHRYKQRGLPVDSAKNDDDNRYPSPDTASVDALARTDGASASPEVTMGAPLVTNGDGRPSPELARLPGRPTPEMTMLASSAGNGEATRWHFLNTDALAWLAACDWRGDEFLYADPPYVRSTRKQARALYRHEMTDADHERLLLILVRLPCPVMVSGYYSAMYAEALTGWHVTTFETTTRGGSPATEWVWMNYAPPLALHDYRYLGDGFRERERIKRKKRRWVEKLRKMGILEKQAILAAIEEMETETNNSDDRSDNP